jgi:transposase-like protein
VTIGGPEVVDDHDDYLQRTQEIDHPSPPPPAPAPNETSSTDLAASFESQLRDLQLKMERRMDDIKKEHEAELRNQQSRHEWREDRLWELIRAHKA